MNAQTTTGPAFPKTEREGVMSAKAAAGKLHERLRCLSPSARVAALRLVAQALGQDLIAQMAMPTRTNNQEPR